MTGVLGQQGASTQTNDFNAIQFVVQQFVGKLATVTLVKILKVTNDGGLAPVGFVDVQPLVNQMTGAREAQPHGTIFNVPYFRLQGGANAIIIDPAVGDIGACMFCSRDISAVKIAKAAANPGSYRSYDWADGLYLGGYLNGTPEQYVRFSDEGVEIVSPSKIRLEAPTVEIVGAVDQSGGDVSVESTLTAGADVVGGGTSLHTHRHSGVTSGGSNTGQPV